MTGWLRRSFLENPLVGRQISTQLTGPRLGLIFVFVTASLLLADVITVSKLLLSDDALAAEGYTGAYLSSVNFLVLLGLLIVLIPIRLAGAIDGARTDKVFDQVVVTGVSPLRIQLGNWALAFTYAIGILLVSLPFQVYAYTLGGVGLTELIQGYGVLAIYSNVIIVVALGLCVLEREWLGVPTTIVNFGISMLVGFLPLPPVFGWLTPVRFFVPEIYRGTPLSGFWELDPVLYLFRIPAQIYPFILWGIIAAPFAALVLLGPAHRFLPGLNNFGNIVLAGDRKRRFFRKSRLVMTRRVELAFFYENRPQWLGGIDYPLRMVLFIGLIIFLWAAAIGLCFDGAPAIAGVSLSVEKDPRAVISILATGLILCFATLALGDARQKLEWRERVGRFSVPRGVLQMSVLGILIAVFFALHWGVLRSAIDGSAALGDASAGTGGAWQSYSRGWLELLGAVVIFVINWYLLGRIIARAVETQVALRFLLLLAAMVVWVGPLILLMGLGERWIPREFFSFVFLSPVLVLLGREGPAMRRVAPAGFNPDEAFGRYLICHGTIAAVLVLCLVVISLASLNRRKQRKRSLKATAVASLLFALFSLGSGGPALAQDSELPLKLDLINGFDGHLFETNGVECRNFFTLTLENKGEKEIRGSVRIEVRGGIIASSRPFVAPPGTKTALRWSEGTDVGRWLGFGSGHLRVSAREGTMELLLPPPSVQSRGAREETRNYLYVSEGRKRPDRGQAKGESWVAASPFCLPEDPRAYSHVDTVIVEGADLSRWTRGQRQALLDYARWGGAVVFHGAMDRATTQTLEGWSSLLSVRRSARVDAGGALLSVEDLEDSTPWGEVETGGEPRVVPILSIRPVAFGRVAHLNVDPMEASLEPGVWDSIWSEGMPRSEYLSGLSRNTPEPPELRDSTSLFAVVGFFSAYAFVVGPMGFFALRKRTRRGWIPLWLVALPLGFAGLLPLLHVSFHVRPSFAALTRVAFFGAGARRGVAFARIDLRSSGRQEHRLELEGRNLSASSVELTSSRSRYGYGVELPELVPFAIAPDEDGKSVLEVHTQPWGRRRIHVVGEAELKTPVTGHAVYSSRTKRVSITVSGLSPEISGNRRGLSGHAFVRLVADQTVRSADLDLGSFENGVFTLELSTDPVTDGIARALSQNRRLLIDELGLDFPSRPAVYLAFESEDVGISVRTKDLAFEREMPEPEEPGIKKPARQSARLELNGKQIRSFQRSLVVVELPLESK